MAKERLFFTGSVRIISDARLTATELRVYACVSLHDGMSLPKGKGAGCYASNRKLASEVGCDYSTLCKALSRLVDLGYLIKTTSSDDRRMTVYRVTFPTQKEWQPHHITDDQIGGEAASPSAEIGGEHLSENGADLPETDEHYIPLKGELDSVETGELNSENQRALKGALLGKTKFDDNMGAQLAQFERAWKADPTAFSDEQITEWYNWLFALSEDTDPQDPDNQRAQRLYYTVDAALWDAKRGPYAAGEAA